MGGDQMFESINSKVVLNNGVEMPCFGCGTYGLKIYEDCLQSVTWALEMGVRLIDTAAAYKNEEWVREAIDKVGVKREDLFITSKVWNSDHGYDRTMEAFKASCERLGTDYLDMYLIHWPCPDAKKYTESWRAMVDLVKAGKIRAIGVSNFYKEHIEACIRETGYVPQLDQLEYSPWLQERELHEYLKENNIQMQSWSPLVRGKILDEPILVSLGEKYGKSPAQIVLRWNLQNGVIIIPRSSKKERVKENMELFDFEISPEDMELINGMQNGFRNGFDANEYHRDAVMD